MPKHEGARLYKPKAEHQTKEQDLPKIIIDEKALSETPVRPAPGIEEAVHIATQPESETRRKARDVAKEFVAKKRAENDAKKEEAKKISALQQSIASGKSVEAFEQDFGVSDEQLDEADKQNKVAAERREAEDQKQKKEAKQKREAEEDRRTKEIFKKPTNSIEETKKILGQEQAARIWDEVMPLFWKRDEDKKQDHANQLEAVDIATEYVTRVAELVEAHKDNTAEMKSAVKKLNKNFSNFGPVTDYSPLEGTGRSLIGSSKALGGNVARAEARQMTERFAGLQVKGGEKAPAVKASRKVERTVARAIKETPGTEGPEIEVREATDAERREVEIAAAAEDWRKKATDEALANVEKSASGLRKMQKAEKDRQEWNKTLEAKLEKKHGIMPEAVYFNFSESNGKKLDADTVNAMLNDPDYKAWVAEFQAVTAPDAAAEEEARKRAENENLVKTIANIEKLDEEIHMERAEHLFFSEGDRMNREAAEVQSNISKDADLAALQGTLNNLENEAKRPINKNRKAQYEKQIAETKRQMLSRYEQVYPQNVEVEQLPEETEQERAEKMEYRRLGEQRNNLLKLNEDLHKEILNLQMRVPRDQKEIDRVSGLLKATESKLHELAETFGDVPIPSEQKPPVMDRVKGFFRNLFGGSTKQQEGRNEPTKVDKSPEEFFGKGSADILTEKETSKPEKKMHDDVEITDVTEVEEGEAEEIRKEAGKKSLMELAKNADFQRANIHMGESITQEALSYFQKQRGLEYKKVAYDADVYEPEQAVAFIVALNNYMMAREQGINRVPAASEINRIGTEAGIKDLLSFAQKLAAKKEKNASRTKKD